MKRNCGKGTKDKAQFLPSQRGTVGKGAKWLKIGGLATEVGGGT